MKKKLAYLISSLTLTTVLMGAPIMVHAMSGSDSGSNSGSGTDSTKDSTETQNSTTSTNDTTKKTETETESSAEDKSSRDTRIEKYKKELKDTVTEAVKIRIAARCIGAQGIVKGKTTSNTAVTKARTSAYTEIMKKLQDVMDAAMAKNIDTTALHAEMGVLETKIAAFTTANTTYQQALADVAALNCKTDPVAFKAALEVARTDQTAVFTAAKAVRTYLTDTVKPTLQTIKAALESAN